MALVGAAMAQAVIGKIANSSDPGMARKAFWDAVKEYVSASGMVNYSWVATLPPPASTPDPMVMVPCTIDVSSDPGLSGAQYGSDPNSALAAFAAECNAAASTWMIMWPAGFAVSPCFIMPTIQFTQSGADNQLAAMTHICTEICNGLLGAHATPAAAGAHAAYIGAGSLIAVI